MNKECYVEIFNALLDNHERMLYNMMTDNVEYEVYSEMYRKNELRNELYFELQELDEIIGIT